MIYCHCQMKQTVFFNRYSRSVETEQVCGEKWIKLAYQTTIGQLSVSLMLKRKFFSTICGWFASRPNSRKKILPFINKYGIKSDSFEKRPDEFLSFNEFFSRKLKPSARPISPRNNSISSPCDGRHLAFSNSNNLSTFFIKGEQLSADDLILDRSTAKKFHGGSVLISRLCLTDYHRFHFPFAGIPEKTFLINGNYLSVHPLALAGSLSTFLQNKRMSTIVHTEHCGDILMVEIGATGCGTICQTFTPDKQVLKGEEKGYFQFGGSTIITFFEPKKISFSEDLLMNTSRGLETYVLMGDEIATINNDTK